MASSLGANTRIPKRNRSELMEFIRLDSPDAKEIIREAQRTNMIEKDTEKIFRTISMCLVRNTELARRYERRRKSLRDQGRKPKELEDRLLFAEESWQGIQKICKSGPHCEKTRDVLGDSQFGLHLNRNFDILLRYTACTKAEGIKFLLVFKVMFGKVKSVTPNLTNDQCTMEPTPNYDTHISLVKPDPEMGICDAQDHNLAYLYEYDEETTLPSMSPSQILPFAVLSLERTGEKIIGPLRTPWQKQRKKRQASINNTFKQQLSEEAHAAALSNKEISSKVDLASAAIREKSGEVSTDNNGSCVKREDTRSSSLDDAHTSVSYPTPTQKSSYGSGRRPTRTLRNTRSKSLGQDEMNKNDSLIEIETAKQDYEEEADLQYTEYLWDPLPELRSSDDTNECMGTATSPQNRNCTLQTAEPASEKSLILQRLKEIEQEIQMKQRKLIELRQSRSSGKSGESVTSEEDVEVDDIITDEIIFSPKRVELGEDSEQPLDLSKTSTMLCKIKIKDEKPTTDYTVKNQSHCNVSVFDTENSSQQIEDVEANPEQKETTKAQLQTPKNCIETDASGDDCNKLKQETQVDLNHGDFETNRDTPTPTLDEPQDICWMDTTQIPLVSKGSPNQCYNKRNDDTRGSKEETDNDTGVNAYIKNKNSVAAICSNTNDSSGRFRTEGGSMKASTKKCSSFYERYIKKKKESMGDHFKLDEKADVSMDASHNPTYLNDATLSRLTDNQNTYKKPMSVAKHCMSETTDHQTVENIKQSRNAAKSSESGLPDYHNNNCRSLNPRDPRIQKRTSQDTGSMNGSVPPPQTNEQDATQTKSADENCITKANQADKSDKKSSTKTMSVYSDRVNCSKIQHESDSDDDHSILACSTCDNCSSSSCEEEPKPVLNEMGVDIICKSDQSLSSKQVDDIIFSVNVSKAAAAETHLSTEVEKTLQDLGDAIKVIQKKVVESDDNRSSSDMNSQTEEEMEIDTVTNENQQAISIIVTERAVRQTNDTAVTKAPTVIKVNCVQEDVLENRAVHEIDQCGTDLQNEIESDLNIGVEEPGRTPIEVVETNLKSGDSEENTSIALLTNDMDVSENLLRDDFKPRNQGFSSYLPDSGRKTSSQTVSKTLFHDVVAIKKCQLTSESQSEDIAMKKEATESAFDQKLAQIDDIVDNTIRKGHITNTEQETKITANATSKDWLLSQEIDKTLTEIKMESCTLYQSHSIVNDNSFRGKEAEKITHESERSASQQRQSFDRNRSRSKSVTGSVTSDSHRKTSHRPRDISPIRDPAFVPFHERGKLLTRYFKDRHKRLGLKWVDRKRSPSGFRVRAIQKAKLTLYKNFSSKDSSVKQQSVKTSVVKTEKVVKTGKKDSDDEDRPLWKPTYFSKPYFKNHSRRFTESKFRENRISSWKDRRGGKPWHKTGTAHPNNLIIDRHGMIITLDPPNNRRPQSGFRNDSVFERRTRGDSVFNRHQNTSRSFQEQRESASRTDPPSSEATLSKAMTSLLKRVLFDGPRNDGSTEGKMADMIFEMVKKKVTSNDNEQSSTHGNVNLNRDETRGFDDLPVDLPPELVSAVRSEHSRDRSTSQDRRSNNWERREVYIERKPSASCDDRKYVERRQGSSQSSDTREDHGDRYHNRTEHRFDRHDRNDNTHHFGCVRSRGRGRGRGRWNWPRGSFNKPFIRNTFNNNNDKRPFNRDSDKYQSRPFSFNASRSKTGSDFSSRRGFHGSDFYNKPYDRKFNYYSTDRKSHHRDSNRKRDSRD